MPCLGLVEFERSTGVTEQLRRIGYWFDPFDESESSYPQPQELVREGWLGTQARVTLLAYLRSAPTFVYNFGYSWCRFRCGAHCSQMGSKELWDGVWVWPEGLVHYVERHHVFLPEEFVERAISGPPPKFQDRRGSTPRPDIAFWLDWASKHSQKVH